MIIKAVNISKDFYDGKQKRRVLLSINTEFYPGELTILSGPSGSGKTTLLSILGLVMSPSEGKVFLDDRDITGLSDDQSANIRLKYFGYVFQQPMLIEGLNLLENVLVALAVQGKRLSNKDYKKAEQILESLGLANSINLKPNQLSGGMKQRASIARALIKDPTIILCDEPTSSLDAGNGQIVMNILKKIAIEEGRIVIVVSHDARVLPYADRLIKLENGEIVSDTKEHSKIQKGVA